jgi:hypothetical protein
MGRCRGCQGAQDPPAATATRYAWGQRLRPADHSGGQCALSTQWECGQSLTSSSSYVQWTQHLRQSQSLVPLTYVGSTHRVTSYSCHGTCGGQWGERTLQGTAEWPGLAWPGGDLHVVVLRNRLAHRVEDAQRLHAERRCGEAAGRCGFSAASRRIPLAGYRWFGCAEGSCCELEQ